MPTVFFFQNDWAMMSNFQWEDIIEWRKKLSFVIKATERRIKQINIMTSRFRNSMQILIISIVGFRENFSAVKKYPPNKDVYFIHVVMRKHIYDIDMMTHLKSHLMNKLLSRFLFPVYELICGMNDSYYLCIIKLKYPSAPCKKQLPRPNAVSFSLVSTWLVNKPFYSIKKLIHVR